MGINTEIGQKELSKLKIWQNDWNIFASEVLRVNLDEEQKQILSSIQKEKFVSVSAGTARGKDFVAAVAALCFLYLTPRFKNGELIENTKVALTAPTGRQIDNVMYPEVSRLFERAKVLPGRLVSTDIRTDYDEWFLTGFKADDTNHEAWSGFHAVNTMFIATEATGISELTCAAIEGNLQGNSRFVLIFNPNTSIGYAARTVNNPRWKFFRLDDLNAINVRKKQIIIPGQVDYEWVKDKVEIWCEKIQKDSFDKTKGDFEWEGNLYRPNDLFRVKVRGMFPEISEDILVPPAWIEAAEERWVEVQRSNKIRHLPKLVGVDIAGMGTDSSVFVDRMGDFVMKIEKYQSKGKADHMKVAGMVLKRLIGNTNAMIDTIGEGAGVYSRLVELGKGSKVHSCKSTESSKGLTDVTGVYEFSNMRAYMHWAVRDWLNPMNGNDACIPPGSNLKKECSEIRYSILSNGKIQIEKKEDIRKRLGYSPDEFDALSLTFYPKASRRRTPIHKLSGYLP